MIALMVWSHVQFPSTPAFLRRCTNAFSPSSTVAKPLCGMTGSSGKLGRAGSTLDGAKGRPPVWRPTAPFCPFSCVCGWEPGGNEDGSVPPKALGAPCVGVAPAKPGAPVGLRITRQGDVERLNESVTYTSAEAGGAVAFPSFSTFSSNKSNSSGMSHFDSFVSVCNRQEVLEMGEGGHQICIRTL